MQEATDFQIDHFMDEVTVAGRICAGDLRRGQHFTSVVRRVFSGPFDSLSCEMTPMAPIDLEITQIEAYGKVHEWLSCGLTAGVRLDGDGILMLRELVRLAPEGTRYSIVSDAHNTITAIPSPQA